jgi:anti-sigma B factor antagonist
MDAHVDVRPDGVAILHLRGRLDLVTAPQVKDLLAKTVAEGHPRLVVDLAEVSFIDSSGLGALISGLKAARVAGGDLRLACVGEQGRVVLGLTTLDRVLRPYATVEEALAGY